MSAREAKRRNIAPERLRFYLPVHNARAAYAPPAEHAEWFEKMGPEIGPARDSIPAWCPGAPSKAVPPSDATLACRRRR